MKFSKFLLPLSVTVGLLALAEVMQRAGLLSVIVPAPSQVLMQIVRQPGMVGKACGATLYAAAIGYVAALAVTGVAAAVAASVRVFYAPVYNVGIVLHSIPVIALAPLLGLWIGTGPVLREVIAALACQFAMLVGLMQGLRAADATQLELMHVLAASRLDTLRFLLVPASLPYLFAGLKIGAPSAVLGAITAEWAGADQGVGVLMLNALFSFDTPKVWLAVLLTCLMAAASYAAWAAVERWAVGWNRGVELAE